MNQLSTITTCISLFFFLLTAYGTPASAYDNIVEKRVFTMPSYSTVGGSTIKQVRIGWEAYGTLNKAKSNAILICHFFGGTSHAAGKYSLDESRSGYWDAIIGSGKPIDTDKYYVISSDTLVNLNVKNKNVVTTGPASIDPDTGKPYGMRFPVVTIRDFVNVQKALIDSLGIKKLHAVIGPSMGSMQTIEWAVTYPQMVSRAVQVIGVAEVNSYTIGWLNLWASPIRIDPNWKNGDYYGGPEPTAGLSAALEMMTLHSMAMGWADRNFGRKWAEEDKNPGESMANSYQIEAALEAAGASMAETSDANSFLYLVRANQTFMAGYRGSLEEGLKQLKAPILFIQAKSDVLVNRDYGKATFEKIRALGKKIDYVELEGDSGHFDGLTAIVKAGPFLKKFIDK